MRKRAKRAGVTMVELMIALAIMAIAIIGVISVILHTIKVKELTRELDIAKEAVASKLESLRGLKWEASSTLDTGPFLSTLTAANTAYQPWTVSDLNHQGWTYTPPSGTSVSYTTAKGTVYFHNTTDGSPYNPTADFNPELLDIEVRIEWYGIDGLRTYSVRSMFTE